MLAGDMEIEKSLLRALSHARKGDYSRMSTYISRSYDLAEEAGIHDSYIDERVDDILGVYRTEGLKSVINSSREKALGYAMEGDSQLMIKSLDDYVLYTMKAEGDVELAEKIAECINDVYREEGVPRRRDACLSEAHGYANAGQDSSMMKSLGEYRDLALSNGDMMSDIKSNIDRISNVYVYVGAPKRREESVEAAMKSAKSGDERAMKDDINEYIRLSTVTGEGSITMEGNMNRVFAEFIENSDKNFMRGLDSLKGTLDNVSIYEMDFRLKNYAACMSHWLTELDNVDVDGLITNKAGREPFMPN